MNERLLIVMWANLRAIMLNESNQPKKSHSTVLFLLYDIQEQGQLIYNSRNRNNYYHKEVTKWSKVNFVG